MTRYRFTLVCPGCNKESETFSDTRTPPPSIKCGDCLMQYTEVIELKVLTVAEEKARPSTSN